MALIHPVKPLKDPALIPLWDTDAGIPNQEDHVPVRFRNLHSDAAAGDIVLHSVLAEVSGDLIQQPPNAENGSGGAGHGNVHRLFRRLCCQRASRLLRQLQKGYLLMGQRTALVQLGQAENIVDQCHQPVRLLMDAAQEPGLIPRLHQAVFQ